VFKQKNYVGMAVDTFFCTAEWSEFMSDYVRPTVAVFDKNLCSVDARSFLEKKATFGDFLDSSSDMLDSLLMDSPPVSTPKATPAEDYNEHAVYIDPHYLDSRLFQIPIQHDIEDLLREVND
jgi:hypothetical protein